MGVFDELQSRGLIAQMTNEEKIRDLLNNEKITFYVGFDPTADSLHVGHFVQIMVMAHMQQGRAYANSPVWRRHGYDRRPLRKIGYAPDDVQGRDSA